MMDPQSQASVKVTAETLKHQKEETDKTTRPHSRVTDEGDKMQGSAPRINKRHGLFASCIQGVLKNPSNHKKDKAVKNDIALIDSGKDSNRKGRTSTKKKNGQIEEAWATHAQTHGSITHIPNEVMSKGKQSDHDRKGDKVCPFDDKKSASASDDRKFRVERIFTNRTRKKPSIEATQGLNTIEKRCTRKAGAHFKRSPVKSSDGFDKGPDVIEAPRKVNQKFSSKCSKNSQNSNIRKVEKTQHYNYNPVDITPPKPPSSEFCKDRLPQPKQKRNRQERIGPLKYEIKKNSNRNLSSRDQDENEVTGNSDSLCKKVVKDKKRIDKGVNRVKNFPREIVGESWEDELEESASAKPNTQKKTSKDEEDSAKHETQTPPQILGESWEEELETSKVSLMSKVKLVREMQLKEKTINTSKVAGESFGSERQKGENNEMFFSIQNEISQKAALNLEINNICNKFPPEEETILKDISSKQEKAKDEFSNDCSLWDTPPYKETSLPDNKTKKSDLTKNAKESQGESVSGGFLWNVPLKEESELLDDEYQKPDFAPQKSDSAILQMSVDKLQESKGFVPTSCIDDWQVKDDSCHVEANEGLHHSKVAEDEYCFSADKKLQGDEICGGSLWGISEADEAKQLGESKQSAEITLIQKISLPINQAIKKPNCMPDFCQSNTGSCGASEVGIRVQSKKQSKTHRDNLSSSHQSEEMAESSKQSTNESHSLSYGIRETSKNKPHLAPDQTISKLLTIKTDQNATDILSSNVYEELSLQEKWESPGPFQYANQWKSNSDANQGCGHSVSFQMDRKSKPDILGAAVLPKSMCSCPCPHMPCPDGPNERRESCSFIADVECARYRNDGKQVYVHKLRHRTPVSVGNRFSNHGQDSFQRVTPKYGPRGTDLASPISHHPFHSQSPGQEKQFSSAYSPHGDTRSVIQSACRPHRDTHTVIQSAYRPHGDTHTVIQSAYRPHSDTRLVTLSTTSELSVDGPDIGKSRYVTNLPAQPCGDYPTQYHTTSSTQHPRGNLRFHGMHHDYSNNRWGTDEVTSSNYRTIADKGSNIREVFDQGSEPQDYFTGNETDPEQYRMHNTIGVQGNVHAHQNVDFIALSYMPPPPPTTVTSQLDAVPTTILPSHPPVNEISSSAFLPVTTIPPPKTLPPTRPLLPPQPLPPAKHLPSSTSFCVPSLLTMDCPPPVPRGNQQKSHEISKPSEHTAPRRRPQLMGPYIPPGRREQIGPDPICSSSEISTTSNKVFESSNQIIENNDSGIRIDSNLRESWNDSFKSDDNDRAERDTDKSDKLKPEIHNIQEPSAFLSLTESAPSFISTGVNDVKSVYDPSEKEEIERANTVLHGVNKSQQNTFTTCHRNQHSELYSGSKETEGSSVESSPDIYATKKASTSDPGESRIISSDSGARKTVTDGSSSEYLNVTDKICDRNKPQRPPCWSGRPISVESLAEHVLNPEFEYPSVSSKNVTDRLKKNKRGIESQSVKQSTVKIEANNCTLGDTKSKESSSKEHCKDITQKLANESPIPSDLRTKSTIFPGKSDASFPGKSEELQDDIPTDWMDIQISEGDGNSQGKEETDESDSQKGPELVPYQKVSMYISKRKPNTMPKKRHQFPPEEFPVDSDSSENIDWFSNPDTGTGKLNKGKTITAGAKSSIQKGRVPVSLKPKLKPKHTWGAMGCAGLIAELQKNTEKYEDKTVKSFTPPFRFSRRSFIESPSTTDSEGASPKMRRKPSRWSTGSINPDCDSTVAAARSAMMTSAKQTYMSQFSQAVYPFVDTHCHLDFLFKRLSYRDTYENFRKLNSDTFHPTYNSCVTIFCDPRTYSNQAQFHSLLSETGVYAAVGCHPKCASDFDYMAVECMKSMLQHPRIVALGEIGLDYSGTFFSEAEKQKEVFIHQVKMALDHDLPLVIHCRDAEEDCIEILKRLVPKNHRIHRHCFTGTWAEAQIWLREFPGSFIGLTPLVTYIGGRSTGPHDVARNIPLEKLLLETDSPYFVPRGIPKGSLQFSHPGMAITVAAEVARLKNTDINIVLRNCLENVKVMYGIEIPPIPIC